MNVYRDEVLIAAIECGQLAVLPLCVIGARVIQPCTATGDCCACNVGIEHHSMNACPFCGKPSKDPQYKETLLTGYVGRIHHVYPCGTMINMCLRTSGEPYTITSVVIGKQCCGIESDDTI